MIKVSVVMPCLNEAVTVGSCVAAARRALDGIVVAGEVIVADNSSSDGLRELARAGLRIRRDILGGVGSGAGALYRDRRR
jgi:glycosyltransferase involved in cell wall biosynthesis